MKIEVYDLGRYCRENERDEKGNLIAANKVPKFRAQVGDLIGRGDSSEKAVANLIELHNKELGIEVEIIKVCGVKR